MGDIKSDRRNGKHVLTFRVKRGRRKVPVKTVEVPAGDMDAVGYVVEQTLAELRPPAKPEGGSNQ